MTFLEKILSAQRSRNSLLCIGLDTDMNKLPEHMRAMNDALLSFNKAIIEATSDLVCAYKINAAFYECAGESGWRTMRETVKSIPSGVFTIGDAKRGDIGNSSSYYARALYDDLGFDAATVAPYMGRDSVEPFLTSPEHGIFLLALTSNPGARDFQYLDTGGVPLYRRVIETAMTWNTKGNIGFVAGATRGSELQTVRNAAGDAPLLIPGVGAQGGSLEEAVRFGADARGERAVINASRSVLYASADKDFSEAARGEALRLRDEMNRYRP
ncbi:MAG: orotidine-5'-phosphate decarboxylase [Ignavibacteriales bacterium]|nr:orotidine-5'-phosphate decarboxylase [Ignavibacteriales bacterium]